MRSCAGRQDRHAAALVPANREGKKRELKRDTSILREFPASESPDVMVLRHHLHDGVFRSFNTGEFYQQLLR